MLPGIPDPDPIPLPGPVWLLWALLILTFTLHVLPMNLMLGGSIIGAVARFRAARGASPHNRRLGAGIAKALPVTIAAAVTFGVAALLFLQVLYGRLFFTASVLMGWWWLSVVPLLIVAYYSAYAMAFGTGAERTSQRRAWVTAGLLTLVGFVYVNNMSLMLRPERFVPIYRADGSGIFLNIADPTWVPRLLHVTLGAAAIAGLTLALVGRFARRTDTEFGLWLTRHGAAWFVGATALNIVAGFWWLLALPAGFATAFLGGNVPATLVLLSGIVLGLAALLLVAAAARAVAPDRPLLAGAGAAGLSLVAMVLTRDQLRQMALDRAGFAPTAWVAPQWGPIAIFVALLVAAVGTVVWMAAVLNRPAAERITRQAA